MNKHELETDEAVKVEKLDFDFDFDADDDSSNKAKHSANDVDGFVFEKSEGKKDEKKPFIKIEPSGINAIKKLTKSRYVKKADKLIFPRHVLKSEKIKKPKVYQIKSEPKLTKPLIKIQSSFTIDRIETLKKASLSDEELESFNKLIAEGKDQEIYARIFGDIFFTKSYEISRNWMCKMCPDGKFIGSKKQFEDHFKVPKHGNVLYSCELCCKSLKSFELLKSHLKRKHFTDAMCDLCGELFPGVEQMEGHQLRVHEEGGVPCEVCSKMFLHQHRLKAHVKAKHGTESYACSICSKSFTTKGACVTHEKTTHNDVLYECSYCVDTFKGERRRDLHVRLQHTKDFEMLVCKTCGKNFKEKAGFNMHMKFHEGHKDLICEICNKLFHKTSTKKKHVAIVHNDVRNFSCERCSYRASVKAKLVRHIQKTHENHQEVCFICNMTVKHAYHHVKSAHKDYPNAWQEFMKQKKKADLLLKSKSYHQPTL